VRYTALLDANVLVPYTLTDILLRLAEAGFFRPLWSTEVLAETERTLAHLHPNIESSRLHDRLAAMDRFFTDATVTGWESLTRGTAPSSEISCHQPANRSCECRDGIIRPESHREYPHTIVSTGSCAGRRVCPYPTGRVIGGNHRSHCAISPAAYVVRETGSGGRYTGRSSATRADRVRIEWVQPIRSAMTVAGIVGYARSSSRIRGSTSSTIDPPGDRSYFGGPSDTNAAFTVFFETPSTRATALIGSPSARCSRRISAQSSTDNIPSSSRLD